MKSLRLLSILIGLSASVAYGQSIAAPDDVIEAMEAHTEELRQGETILDGVDERDGYAALYLPAHKVTIVTHREWA